MNQKGENNKLDWMYKGANSLIDREEYLLGKSVDKPLEQLNKEEKDKRVGIVPPNNHVEHECIPPSIRDFNKIVQAEQVDLSAKLQEDPLVAIRKQEEEARRQFLQNPVQLKKLQDALKSQELKKKNKKVKKSKKSKDILEQLKRLKNGQVSSRFPEMQGKKKKDNDLDTILIHKLSMFRDKLSQKELDNIKAGKRSDSEETEKENSGEDSESDEKTSKSQSIHERNQKYEKKSKFSRGSREKGDTKYIHMRTLSNSSEESAEYNRKMSKSSRESRVDETRRNHFNKISSKYIDKRTHSSSSDEDDGYDRKKIKSSGKSQNRKSHRSRSSSRGNKNRGEEDSISSRKRTQSSSNEESDDYQRKAREARSKRNVKSGNSRLIDEKYLKKDKSKYIDKVRKHHSSSEESDDCHKSKSKSSRDTQSTKIHRGGSSTERSNEKNINKVGSKYRRTQSNSSSSGEESDWYNRKNSNCSRDSRVKKTSSSNEKSKRNDNRNKHSNDGKNEDQGKVYGPIACKNLMKNDKPLESRKSDLDRLISEKLKMLRDSLPGKSEIILEENSNNETFHYDSDNDRYVPKKKMFGLVIRDSTKIPLKEKAHENLTKKPVKKSETSTKPDVKKTKRLTEEEKEKLRKQMMADATIREAERSENLKRYRQEDEREQQSLGDFDKNFVHKELLKGNKNATVETRLKSNLINIQRSAQHMNSNFSRR